MAKIFKYKKEIVHLSSPEDLKKTSHLEAEGVDRRSTSVSSHPATGTRLSPRHLETSVAPYPAAGAGVSPRHLQTRVSPRHLETRVSPYPAAGAGVSPRHLEAGIGWVDLHPDGGLCQTGIQDYNQISQSHSSKKILEKELDLEKNKSQSGSMEPEDTKKKRRRFRPRNRRRGGTDHHSRRKGEDAHLESDFRIGRTDKIERRGKKRKLDRLTGDGDDFGRRRYGGHNDIDVRPKLSPTALDPRQVEKLDPRQVEKLDPRQVEKYVLEDPALNSKRRRIDRNSRNCEGKRGKGILGSPPRGRCILGSPPRGRCISGSSPRGNGIFGSPPSRGNGIFGSPPSARNKLGAAPGIVYSPTELRKLQTEKTAMKWPSFLSPCCKNKRGFWDPFIFHAKTAGEVRKNGSGAAAVNVTVKKNLTRDIREAKKGLENSDMKNGTNNLTHSSDISRVSSTEVFKKDIKDIVRKTLSAQSIPKEVKLAKLFESEMENIDSPDNFSDNDFGEDLLNLPEPVPALKKNSNHNKISAFTDLPQPVPAHKINSDINKKSTFEIIKAMKTVKCQVKINPKSEIRDAIADEVRILKNLDQIKEEDIKLEESNTVDHGVNLSLAIDNFFDESTNFNISVPADDTIAGSAVNKITESVDNIADPADNTIARPSDVKIDKLVHNKIYEPTDYNIAETAHEPDSISKPVDNNLAELDDDKTVKSAYNNLREPTDNNVAKPVDSKINKYSDKNIAVIAQIKDDCGTEIKIEKLEAMHNILDQSKAINREVMHNENNQIDLENEQDLGENVTVDEMGRKEAALFLAWLPKETDKNDVIDDGKVNVKTGDDMVESEEFALKCDFGEFDVKYCFICEEYDHFMREECLICKSCGQKLTAASARGHYIKECSKNIVTCGAGDISSKIEIKIQAP